MSLPQVIAVAIAMAVVYYLLGLVVSFLTTRINEFFETRGSVLQGYIKNIVGAQSVGDFYHLPQLEALKPVRFAGILGPITAKVKVKDTIEKIPVANLVDAFFDFCKIGAEKKEYTAGELKLILANLPESEGKTRMLALVDKGVTNVDELRNKISMWFGGVLCQAGMHYKANTRLVVILLSMLVTIAFAVDSIDLSRQFWNNTTLRELAAAKADAMLRDNPQSSIGELVSQLGDLHIMYGWSQLRDDFSARQTSLPVWLFWKIIGLTISTLAIAQGSSFWYDILRNLKGDSAASKPETVVEDPVG